MLFRSSIALKLCPEYPDTKEYGRIPIGDMVQNKLDEFLVPIRREDIQSGDVGLFKFNKDPQHIGIFTDIGIIHAYSTVGQCVEHSFTDPWPSRMLQAYCFKELL